MGYKLYGDLGSGSAIVEMALAELGLPVQLCEVPLATNAQQGDQYASLNPQRKVPCLVTPDGEVLTESVGILLTLDERYTQSDLLPASPIERAQVRRWLLFMASELYPLIEIVDYPERFQPDGESLSEARLEALRDHARGLWNRRFLIIEQTVSADLWFLPTGFSALDIYVSVLSRWTQADWREECLPHVERIAKALSARPAVATIWEKHFSKH